MNEQDCLRQAWQCLLKNDLKGRDYWCARATGVRNMRIRVKEGGPPLDGEPIKLVRQPDDSFVAENLLKSC